MGEFTRLMARDGHEFDAWLAPPPGMPRGAVLVLQEIFGVNTHIQAVADGFAEAGYVAIAPALFDRARRGVQMGYTADEVQLGRGYVLQIKEEELLRDMQACINVVKHAGPVAAVGYCWGGSLAYLAACKLPVRCAVSYYGTRTVQLLEHKPRVPVQYHFGALDKTIPPESIEKIRVADPDGDYHIYDADHGFNCDHRAAWNAAAASQARERTLAFIERNLTGSSQGPGDDEQIPDKWSDA